MGPRGRLNRVQVPGPFGGIHVFIGKIGEPGPEPDIYTDLVETAQRASPAQIKPAVKHAFVGCGHGIGSEPVSEGRRPYMLGNIAEN